MNDVAQPAFWLEVKKEYIIENFDRMLAYLEQYHYVEGEEDGSFMTTFNCLRDFVSDIFEQTSGSNLCRVAEYEGIDEKLLVRIVAVYLLVCHKIGRQDLHVLSMLANRLLLKGEATTSEIIENMRMLQLSCLRRRNVVNLAYSWNNIRDNDSMSLNYMAYAISNTEFGQECIIEPIYYENKGTVLITADRLRIMPMNYSDYRKNGAQVQFAVAGDTEICVERRERVKLDSFDKLVDCKTSMINQQKNVKPSPVKKLKNYDLSEDIDVFVEITKIDINFVYARTVDKEYNIVEGGIYIPSYIYSADSESIRQYLKVGMIIKVCLQNSETIPFSLQQPFEDYYYDLAERSCFINMPAYYYRDYKLGYCWLTENGLIVNIRDGNDMEEVKSARILSKPLPINIFELKDTYNDKLALNGNYVLESLCCRGCVPFAEFQKKAVSSLIEGYFELCSTEYIPAGEEDKSECITDVSYILPMAYVFYKHACKSYISTRDRYENLVVALMIAVLCDAEEDALFISHEMKFITSLVSFAQGADPGSLMLTHDKMLDDNRSVEYKEHIINILSEYRQDSFTVQNSSNDSDDTLSNVNDLVHASNILLHKINTQEINRIKKNITAVLGVEDMFKHNEESSTYYGEENDTLEFKSSVVYPPVNKRENQTVPAELKRQMWNILKAVCGFLNSMSGGELLIGVSDNGYSCGVQSDIDYLYDNGKITEPTMDRYIQYIKYNIDYAFCDNSGTAAEATEITTSRIRYVSETNKEDNRILRIQISPYEYGVVEFANKNLVPEDMSTSYQRSSNTTMPLNKEMKELIEKNKLSERADAGTQKIMNLQKARKNQRAVILKGYNSKSGKRDRNVEAYKILLARNAVICYDLDKHELREYKITRFDEVVETKKKWKNFKAKYNELGIDLFDMLEGNSTSCNVVLKLAQLPYNLILEECNGAERYITPNTDDDKDRYPWVLSTTVYGMYGIGRFYMGLANDIKIVEGEELKKYVREYISKISV